jgi:archaellum component FlaG (FlaF/FlaG flagellin family)|tara:strand:- start:520 stop:699 length:180 start_codon:yes stop_codon:yes gene_type:complete
MQTFIIIISIVMFLTALMMALTVYGIFTDKDKDGIPDALEDKFNQVVSDIKQEIEKIKK